MLSKSFALALVALSSSVSAQTFSLCDPLTGKKCPPNPAYGQCKSKVHEFDFKTVSGGDGWAKDSNFKKWWTPDGGVVADKSQLSIDPALGAVFTITNEEQAPLLRSKQYIFFGKVEIKLKAAPGVGIVTSVVLESDDRDEVDFEWVGGDRGNVQTNFFSKGVNEFVHGKTHPTGFDAMAESHVYAVEWTRSHIIFSVDGQEIRRATPAEAENGAKWPQTPCMIKLGTWVGGKKSLPEGTISWAGGLADFSQAPFVAHYEYVKVTDYCGDKDSLSDAGEYSYGDSSGHVDSIVISGSKSSEEDESSSSVQKPTSSSGSNSTSPKPTESDGSSPDGTPKQTEAPGAGAVTRVSSTLAVIVFLGFLMLQ